MLGVLFFKGQAFRGRLCSLGRGGVDAHVPQGGRQSPCPGRGVPAREVRMAGRKNGRAGLEAPLSLAPE